MPKFKSEPKRKYRVGTIYSLNKKNPDKGPFEGVLRKVIDGKRRASPKKRGDTKTEVQNQLTQWEQAGGFDSLIAKMNPAPEPAAPPPAETVGGFLQAWFDSKLPGWKPLTAQTNTKNFNKHIKGNAAFCNANLKDIDLNTVDALLASMTGSQNTKYNILRLIRPAFTRAVNRHKLASNPFTRLEKDAAPKRSKSRVVCFSDADEKRLIQYISRPTINPLWMALIFFGLDAGAEPQEFLGIQWGDIRAGRVYLHRTVVVVDSMVTVQEGAGAMKADARARDFALSPTTLSALEVLRESTPAHTDTDYVFSPNGRPWNYHRFHDGWTKLLKLAGVAHCPPLTMRHTMASQMISDGEPIPAVSARLGHGDITTTLKHYVDFIPNDFEKLASSSERRFQRLLSSPETAVVRGDGSVDGSLEAKSLAA